MFKEFKRKKFKLFNFQPFELLINSVNLSEE